MTQRSVSLSARITQFIVVGLAAAFFLEQAGLREMLGLAPKPGAAVAHWAHLIAPGIFLWTFWRGTELCLTLDRGAAFGPEIVSGLGQVGWGLSIGAFCAIALQPAIVHLAGNNFAGMRGVAFDWTLSNFVIALSGVMLILLSKRGARIQAKVDEII